MDATQEVIRNTAATLQVTFTVDGNPTDVTGNVTVAIVGSNGSSVGGGTAVHGETGVYTFALAPRATLDLLTVTWSGTLSGNATTITTTCEIVGGVYLQLAAIRALPGLENEGKFGDDKLTVARREFERVAEDYCGQNFVPRFKLDRLAGNDRTQVQLSTKLPRSVIWATLNGSAIDITQLGVYDHGRLERLTAGFPRGSTQGRNLAVAYEAGRDAAPPSLVRASKDWIRHHLLGDVGAVGRDVLSWTDPGGYTTRYSTPDWDAGRPTGLLDVDSILNSLQLRL